VLEHKLKDGAVSGKRTQPLPAIEIELCEKRLRAAIDRLALQESLRAELRQIEPIVVTRYFRYYFANPGGRIRVTIDTHLQFAAIRGRARAALVELTPGFVVEMKYAPKWAEQAVRVADDLPFRLAKCSKYQLGVERVAAMHR
jgi:hypothetical protein